MKFGLRKPSLKKRISARTSVKRLVRHKMGLKAPKGMGIVTNPKKAIYNKVYNKTSFSIDDVIKKGKSSRKKDQSKSRTSSSKKEVDYITEKINNKSYRRNFCTKGEIICKKCNSDSWAIVTNKVFFTVYETFYCEKCHEIGATLKKEKGESNDDFLKRLF